MNRRQFVLGATAGAGVMIGGSAFLYVGRSRARAEIAARLLDDALPPLAAASFRELTTHPVRAREEIRRFFLGKCLNVEGFVTHVCSSEFRERLGRCRTQDEREICFWQSFCSRIATEAEILNQVQVVTAEIGSELDVQWDRYCAEQSVRWNTRMHPLGGPLSTGELSERTDQIIRAELRQAARQPMSGGQSPAVGETLRGVGQSALLLLPMMTFGSAGLAIGVPLFIVLAARHVWDYAAARLDDRRGDYQFAISERLALLGNRVGAEFEREVRLRLTNLHSWQDRSVRDVAGRLAEERIGLI